LGIEGPGKYADFRSGNVLLASHVVRGVVGGGDHQIGATQRAATQERKRLPDFEAMGPDDGFRVLAEKPGALRDGREKRVAGDDQFGAAASGAGRGDAEMDFSASAAGEHKIARAYGHAVQFRRIIQAEQAAIDAAARGKFAHYGGDVAAGALDTAGSVQLGEESKEHGLSLPSAAPEHKMWRGGGFRRSYGALRLVSKLERSAKRSR